MDGEQGAAGQAPRKIPNSFILCVLLCAPGPISLHGVPISGACVKHDAMGMPSRTQDTRSRGRPSLRGLPLSPGSQ